MRRLVLLLLILLVLPVLVFPVDQSSDLSAPAAFAQRLAGASTTPSTGIEVMGSNCIGHLEEASSSILTGCKSTQGCGVCTLCHVCHPSALADDKAQTPTITSFHTLPTQFAAHYLSADGAPDFKPPIL